jgi:hypothetical protein
MLFYGDRRVVCQLSLPLFSNVGGKCAIVGRAPVLCQFPLPPNLGLLAHLLSLRLLGGFFLLPQSCCCCSSPYGGLQSAPWPHVTEVHSGHCWGSSCEV